MYWYPNIHAILYWKNRWKRSNIANCMYGMFKFKINGWWNIKYNIVRSILLITLQDKPKAKQYSLPDFASPSTSYEQFVWLLRTSTCIFETIHTASSMKDMMFGCLSFLMMAVSALIIPRTLEVLMRSSIYLEIGIILSIPFKSPVFPQ